jgi:pyochelin synthetase
MMQSLLATLSALQVKIEARDGKLHVNAPAGVLTPELRKEISLHRDALIEKLQASSLPAPPREELPLIVPDPEHGHEPFPLNTVQHAYWVGRGSHVELGEVTSHVYFEFECESLDPERLTAAFRKVVALHGMLRAAIDINGEQRILASVPEYEIAVTDLRGADPERREAELLRIRSGLSHQMFSCDQWPQFEIRLIQIADGHSRLCASWDFLVVDAWSLSILFEQWHGFYHDPAYAVSPPLLSFRDYVLAEARLKALPSYEVAKKYWWDRLDELPSAPLLPVVNRIERGRAHEFKRRRFRLPARQWEAVKTRARRSGLTLSSLLLAAFAEVLNRWAKSPHYALNLTLFNRLPLHEEVNAIIGDFTNLLVLEVDGRQGETFLERAARIQERFLSDFEHRQVSAIEVLRELAKRRNWQQRAILPIVFTSTLMLDGKRGEDAGGWERFGPMGFGISQTPQVSLDYQIFEVHGDLVINWDAVDEVFFPGVLDDMFAAQVELLESLALEPETWEKRQPVPLPAAQRRIRDAVNDTAAERLELCLHAPFVERALERPDRTALAWSAGTMSYGELLAHSWHLAGQLVERGVRPNELVAVVMRKGWEQVAAVLGVLMAGAAYLPVDARWPALRRQQILEQGGARIALTQEALDRELEWPARVERILVAARQDLPRPAAAPAPRSAITDLAYVIFTSGSTGMPKGVMIDHRAAVNTVIHLNRLFGVGDGDSVLAVSDLTFDLSVYDIFGLLAVGGTVVIPDSELSRDPGHWTDLIRRWKVTLWDSAPPLMGVLADALESAPDGELAPLRLVMLSGDWIPVQLPDRVRRLAPDARVVSLGGATEGSIWSIYYPIGQVRAEWDSIPYGKALPNQHMYVLNHRLEPCPDRVTGNIYIGGTGVALGYWQDPERTRRQFIAHPETGESLYFTGDLGRFFRDGNIEFLGREDSQVKLRGHRVELGEIAACLQTHPEVRDALVRLIRQGERSALAAYVVAASAEGSRLFERNEVPEERLRQAAALVGEAGREHLREADAAGLEIFWEFWQRAERAGLRSLFETLRSLGVLDGGDVAAHQDRLVGADRVKPRYRRLVARWLRVLADGGHLDPHGGIAAAEPLEEQLAGLERSFGQDERLQGFLAYFASSLRNHLALFSGEVAPLELLFPDGSWHLAEALYEKTPVARHHNGMMGAAVSALVRGWEGDRRVRVLEVGAGTGGTTGAVLAELPAERTEYWFTDLSNYFLNTAKEKFAGYPFVRYGIFDIDKPAASQGHQPHSFDLIVAANVLHNATDVNATLGRIRDLLRPGGYLLMLEGTRTNPWQWSTISFLEAVTAYADERIDADAPLLGPEEWSAALTRSRFAAVSVFPARAAAAEGGPARHLDAMPQHVIAAQAPAVVHRFRPEELTDFLRERLPAHMVPQRYFLLESLPLSANGKVDLSALPTELSSPAQGGAEERRVISPRSETEERLLKLWKEILGIDQLGIFDNFFEAGGDSLLLTGLLRRVNEWQERPLTIAHLFSYPTVQSLAEYLSQGAKARQSAALERTERDVAIIGLAGRFPDARNVGELWENLAAGRCAVRSFTDEELLEAGVSPDDLAQEGYVRAGLVLEDMELFDAGYFGFTPLEAEIMDPQQRFLLECAVEALESAGYPSEKHAGRIGVFVGKGTSRYFLEHVLQRPDLVRKLGLMALLNFNEKDYAATHVAYKLNLTGPALNLNTACSTSLVAVHSACQSLLNGECEVALAGGVSFVSTLRRSGYLYYDGHIASPDGLCRAFSDDANGTVFGNGAGLVVLKPLSAALRDRDTIHAVIKGSAINNDGAMKVGFNAPGLHGQVAAVAGALERAGVSPGSIQLLEAHGTGTNLGDPIEFGALREVFGGPRPDGSRCALGSIKTNIGHLDSAAGIAGLIKVVEALKHRLIPPTLHVSAPSRKIDFADSPFALNSGPLEWKAGREPRRAGVSSFGVGGTNAHVVIEEAPAVATEGRPPGGPQLLPLSAKSPRSLKRIEEELADELGRHPELSLEDVAFTLQAGRNRHKYRSHLICDQLGEARSQLAAGRLRAVAQSEGQTPSVAFLLPGQGAQRRDLTFELYETQAAFRGALDQCAEILRMYTGHDIRDWLYTRRAPELDFDIDQTVATQPLLFAVEYALARFWESLGIRPAAMLGHSLGELVAACLAGVFSLEEALSLVVVRGQLLQSLEPGRMLAVSCGEAQLREPLQGTGCSVAAVNSPQQCVVSGPVGEIEQLQARLQAADITSRPLRTSHAFHSAMVEPILATFEQCVAEVRRNRPQIPFLSNLTGTWITDEQAMSPSYWARHLRETVRFDDGARELLARGSWVLLEVGPGHTLSTLVKGAGLPLERIVPTLGYGNAESERAAVLDALGQLWSNGVEVDWMRLHEGRQPRRVPLPTYAFDRKRYWIENRGLIRTPARGEAGSPREIEAEAAFADEPEELPATHARPELRTEYAPPANELEARLVAIWQSYLGIGDLGVRDNFFELGGDSLLATRVYAQVRKELDVEIPLEKMFELATIRRISLFIAARQDPESIDTLSEEELDDLLAVMEL